MTVSYEITVNGGFPHDDVQKSSSIAAADRTGKLGLLEQPPVHLDDGIGQNSITRAVD